MTSEEVPVEAALLPDAVPNSFEASASASNGTPSTQSKPPPQPSRLPKTSPTLDEVQSHLSDPSKGNCIPVWSTLSADVHTPVSVFLRLTDGARIEKGKEGGGGSFLLESVVGGAHVGRYTFVGADPMKVIRTGDREEIHGDPLIPLQKELDQHRFVQVPGAPPFTGGAIGYVAYDCVKYFEPKTSRPLKDPVGVPESVFMLCDTIVVFDHLFQTLKIVSHVYLPDDEPSSSSSSNSTPPPTQTSRAQKTKELYDKAVGRISDIQQRLMSSGPLPLPRQPPLASPRPEPVSNVGKDGYEGFVTKLKEHIVLGDIIQAVPSQRLRKETNLHPFNAYRHLRTVNPSPYMFYVDCGDGVQLVGASPECLVKVEKNVVTNHAIAGTIKRGSNPQEDDTLAEQLRSSIKDRAEHVMLVDLARNDVNRVCQPKTVKVDSLMQVEKFSHVMHLTSQVSGTLRKGLTRFDAFRSIFPAGTVSGAPKIRAMELIGELEGERRGVYAGAVGRFNFADDAMDTCIAIRTMTFKDGAAYLQAGGGIVFDSDEYEEYVETLNKLKSNVNALQQAEDFYSDLAS